MRHDVDMSLEAATRLAELEHRMDVRAILLRAGPIADLPSFHRGRVSPSPQASGSRSRGRPALRRTLYSGKPEALEDPCGMECELLERFLGRRVEMISFHRPVPALVGLGRSIAGRRHAYEPRFVTDIGYCSDSRGGWFRGHPLQHKAVTEGRALQLLTHPIWWDARAGETTVEKLNRFALGRFDQLRIELARNCSSYREGLTELQGSTEPPPSA